MPVVSSQRHPAVFICFISIILVFLLSACGGGGSDPAPGSANLAPEITSLPSAELPENTSLAYLAMASDPEGSEVTFSLSGGPDVSAFVVDEHTGQITFEKAPDYETPADSNADNIYQVELDAADNRGKTSTLSLVISVTDVDEPPVLNGPLYVALEEGKQAIAILSATDPEGSSVSYEIDGGEDSGLFLLDAESGALSFGQPPDFEAPRDSNGDNQYEVRLVALDAGGLSVSIDVSVAVVDVTSTIVSEIVFPPKGARFLNQVEEVAILGRIRDLNGETPDIDEVTYIDVEGTLFSPDPASFPYWRVRVPVTPGRNAVQVEVGLSSGETLPSEVFVDNEPFFRPGPLALDAANNRVLSDAWRGNVTSTDLTSGERLPLIDCGATDYSVKKMAVNASGDRLLRLESRTFNSPRNILRDIDIAGRTCDVIPVPESPESFFFDESRNRAIVFDSASDEFRGINLDTGDRTVLSGPGQEPWLELSSVTGMTLDLASNRLLVIGRTSVSSKLFSVDLSSGNRTQLMYLTDVTYSPGDLVLDDDGDTLYASNGQSGDIYAISLSSGTKQKVVEGGEAGTPLHTGRLTGMVRDPVSADLVIGVPSHSSGASSIVTADLSTGEKELLTTLRAGSGAGFNSIQDTTYDPASQRAYVLDRTSNSQIVEVDLESGDRLRRVDVGLDASAISFDELNNRLVVAGLVPGTSSASVVSVLLPDYQMQSLADLSVDSDTPYATAPAKISLVDNNTRAIILDTDLQALLDVDLSAGSYQTLSGNGVGPGPQWLDLRALAVDEVTNQALVNDGALGLVAVDLATGERTDLFSSVLDTNEVRNLKDMILDNDGSTRRVLGAVGYRVWEIDLNSGDGAEMYDRVGPSSIGRAIGYDPVTGLLWSSGLRSIGVADTGSGSGAILSR